MPIKVAIPQKQLKQVLTVPRVKPASNHPVIAISEGGISCSHYNPDGLYVTRSWGDPVSKRRPAVSVPEIELRAVRGRLQGAEPEVHITSGMLQITTSTASWKLAVLPEDAPAGPDLARVSQVRHFTATECQILGNVVESDPFRGALQWAVADQEHDCWWVTDSYTAIFVKTDDNIAFPAGVNGMAVPRAHFKYHSQNGCMATFEYSPSTDPGSSGRVLTAVQTSSVNEKTGVRTVVVERAGEKGLLPEFPHVFKIEGVNVPAQQALGGWTAFDRDELTQGFTGCTGSQVGIAPAETGVTLHNVEQLAGLPAYTGQVGCDTPPKAPLALSRDRMLALLGQAPASEVLVGWGSTPAKGVTIESGQLLATIMPIRVAP